MVSCSKIKKNNFNSLFFQLYIILSILFCCSLFSIQASQNNLEEGEKFVREVKLHLKDFDPNVFKDKDIVIFLGPTGSGKTTLLNLINNSSLTAITNDKGDWEIEGGSSNLVIGHSTKSQTFFPTLIKIGETYFCDAPGFGDTRGADHDVAKAFFLKSIGNNCKSTKVVSVCDWDTLKSKRGSGFTESLNDIKGFISDLKFPDQVTVVVTKIPRRNTKQHVENTLKDFGYVPSRLGTFFQPDDKGNIEELNISDLIMKSPAISGNQYNTKLSSETITYIDALISNLNETIIGNNVCGNLYTDFSNHCSNLINTHLGSADDLRRKLSKVSIKGEKFNTKEDIIGILDFTGKLQNENLFSRIIEVLNYIKFVTDRSEDSIHTWTDHANISNIIKNAKRDITELTKIPEVDKNGQYLTFKGFIIGAKDVHQALGKYYGDQISEINLYCLNTMFIDEDISAQGVNLILTSPQWRVVGKRTINLEGKEGAAYKHEKANNGISYGENGKDGSPGTPGLPGGHFYGKGKEFTNLSSLTINVSGGTGGKGQNGGNGAEGILGGSGGLEDVKNGKKLILRKRIEAQGVGGYMEKGSKFLLTYNDKFKEVYESYEPGKSGGNAGKGGEGGFGGKPGSVNIEPHLSYLKEKPITLIGDGARGTNGSHGTPGLGGQNGAKYSGVYINEIIAPSIRGYAETEDTVVITATGTTAAVTGGAILGAQNIAQTVTKHVLADTSKVVMKEGVKTVVKEGTKQVFKEGSKVVVTEGTKVVAKGALQNIAVQGGKAVVNVAAPSAFGVITGMAGGIVAQGGLSLVSSLLSSGWEKEPYLASYDTGRASPGIIPISYNELGIKYPSVTNLSSLSEKEKSYNNFVSEKEKDFSKYIIKF